jgi:hypothetical protein
MSQYRPSVFQGVLDLVNLVWRPQCILPLFYVMLTFGFGIGINVTNAVFVASPPPIGFGFEGKWGIFSLSRRARADLKR